QPAVAAHELAVARSALKPGDPKSTNAVAAAEQKVAASTVAVGAAHLALALPIAEYKPLGEQLPHKSTGRRLAFAKRLVDRRNPLAARVAVNHIGLRHFGAPLVDNMSDFGLGLPQPRDHQLRDWLAVALTAHNRPMQP